MGRRGSHSSGSALGWGQKQLWLGSRESETTAGPITQQKNPHAKLPGNAPSVGNVAPAKTPGVTTFIQHPAPTFPCSQIFSCLAIHRLRARRRILGPNARGPAQASPGAEGAAAAPPGRCVARSASPRRGRKPEAAGALGRPAGAAGAWGCGAGLARAGSGVAAEGRAEPRWAAPAACLRRHRAGAQGRRQPPGAVLSVSRGGGGAFSGAAGSLAARPEVATGPAVQSRGYEARPARGLCGVAGARPVPRSR